MKNNICIAPMMDWTDRHCRFFLRQISEGALLYTEMVTADAVLSGDTQRLLSFSEAEQPLALQLGGSDPIKLAKAAKIGESMGYQEINLNVGCPSDRVQAGRFGVCLLEEPDLVAQCVSEMIQNVEIPVTVKTRVGVDENDSFEFLMSFVNQVAEAGCEIFIVHARKAWLKGLSPKQNRQVPPLDYERVYRLKRECPNLMVVINGGIADMAAVDEHLQQVDGVMLGRAAYHNAYLLSEIDERLFGHKKPKKSRDEVVLSLEPYVAGLIHRGIPLRCLTRHMLGLYQGQPGARRWRRYLSENADKPGAGFEVLRAALDQLSS